MTIPTYNDRKGGANNELRTAKLGIGLRGLYKSNDLIINNSFPHLVMGCLIPQLLLPLKHVVITCSLFNTVETLPAVQKLLSSNLILLTDGEELNIYVQVTKNDINNN